MKKNLPLQRGIALKNMLEQLDKANLSDIQLFYSSIYIYCRAVSNSYKLIKESDNNYLFTFYTIRMLIDAIYSVYALGMVGDKEAYLKKFLSDKQTNNIKVEGKQLTSNHIGATISKVYAGLDELYRESCRYLHPSIYYKMSKHTDIDKSGVLSKYNSWGIKGGKDNEIKIQYIVEALSGILYDVQLSVFNTAIVPLYPDILQPIQWNPKAMVLDAASCKEYIKHYRDR
jgi:hypothetical protein